MGSLEAGTQSPWAQMSKRNIINTQKPCLFRISDSTIELDIASYDSVLISGTLCLLAKLALLSKKRGNN